MRNQSQWAAQISAAWRSTVESIIECGRLLVAAKTGLPHGQFEKMVERDLPFGASTARRLMAIANDKRITKRAHGLYLPPSWRTLYELTRLPDVAFLQKIADGTINPEMERRDVQGVNYERERAADAKRVGRLVARTGKFPTVILDPSWPRGGARVPYTEQSPEEIAAMPVREWLADEGHLYMWVTVGTLPLGLALLGQWGVPFKSMLTWLKTGQHGDPKISMGHYFRNTTEHVLFGAMGKLRTRDRSIGTTFSAPVAEHSEKPEVFYDIVRAQSFGPYGEANQRIARPGFTSLYREVKAARRAA
jgi:N6-adenosine-specific RNA methylase IME4